MRYGAMGLAASYVRIDGHRKDIGGLAVVRLGGRRWIHYGFPILLQVAGSAERRAKSDDGTLRQAAAHGY